MKVLILNRRMPQIHWECQGSSKLIRAAFLFLKLGKNVLLEGQSWPGK